MRGAIAVRFATAALAGTLAVTIAHAQGSKPEAAPTPGFNHKIPEKVMTPNTVTTPIGTLNFVDGVPTDETTRTLEPRAFSSERHWPAGLKYLWRSR